MPDSEIQMYTGTLTRRVDWIIDSMDGLSPEEIEARPPVPESNSLLVLAVHTMSNVEENILEIIGGQHVGRDRDGEFRSSGRTVEDVRAEWSALKERVLAFMDSVTPEMLDREYEHYRRGRITGRKVLLSATVHAAEHAGHAGLTRDWILAQR